MGYLTGGLRRDEGGDDEREGQNAAAARPTEICVGRVHVQNPSREAGLAAGRMGAAAAENLAGLLATGELLRRASNNLVAHGRLYRRLEKLMRVRLQAMAWDQTVNRVRVETQQQVRDTWVRFSSWGWPR